MMGIKERNFRPLPQNLSLENLVPRDNFYRCLEERLDLSFVKELVVEYYAAVGRPSIDPEVFFRLQLVMFFEGIRSERQLMEVAADRLSIRWYLGYDYMRPCQTTPVSPGSASAMVYSRYYSSPLYRLADFGLGPYLLLPGVLSCTVNTSKTIHPMNGTSEMRTHQPLRSVS
jgi:hypothetical protein